MSDAWSHEPSRAGPDSELARAIARKLCSHSLAWARTLAVSVQPSRTRPGNALAGRNSVGAQSATSRVECEDEMFVEVLAYSLRLLEMRVAAALPADSEGLVTLVRHECSVLVSQARWRRRNRCRRLPAADPTLSGSRYARLHPAHGAGGSGQARLTREMFEQFCQCTGLGSDVLVGKGKNLATLVFYIAAHGVLSARGLPTREEVLRLLRAASACAIQMERAISRWLSAERPTPPALVTSQPAPALPARQPHG